jgi:hypothetical protein
MCGAFAEFERGMICEPVNVLHEFQRSQSDPFEPSLTLPPSAPWPSARPLLMRSRGKESRRSAIDAVEA